MRRLPAAFALALLGCSSQAPAPSDPHFLLHTEPARRFSDGEAPARETAFSPDGRLLATTSASGLVTFRHMPGLRVARTVVHQGGATAIAFSPDDRWFATAGYDHNVRLWEIATGRPIRTLGGSGGTIWTIAVSPDGRLIAAAGEDKIVRIWSTDSGRLLHALRGHSLNIWQVDFSPDGSRLASAGFDKSVRIWDPRSGALVRLLEGHNQAVVGLAYSRDGARLASSGDDSTIRLWRTSDWALLRTIAAGNHIYSVAFSPNGRFLASGGRARSGLGTFWHQLTGWGSPADAIGLWRISDGALIQTLKAEDDVTSVAFSPDGRWLASASEDSTDALWASGRP
jgi:WD40 repeat protein